MFIRDATVAIGCWLLTLSRRQGMHCVRGRCSWEVGPYAEVPSVGRPLM